MAEPQSPVIPGYTLTEADNVQEATYCSPDPDVLPLPVLRFYDRERTVLSRWHLTPEERLRVAVDGNIYLYQLTHGNPLQPQALSVEPPLAREENAAQDAAPAPMLWSGCITTHAVLRLGLLDRLRVLLGRAVRVSLHVRTQAPPGKTDPRCEYVVDGLLSNHNRFRGNIGAWRAE